MTYENMKPGIHLVTVAEDISYPRHALFYCEG